MTSRGFPTQIAKASESNEIEVKSLTHTFPREKSLGLQLWPRSLSLSDEIWNKPCVAKAGLLGDYSLQSLAIRGEIVHMQAFLVEVGG